MQPKALFADAVSASKTSILVNEMAKLLRQNGVEIGEKKLFKLLRVNGYLCSKGELHNCPTQRAMDMGLFEIKETAITTSDGSVILRRTPKVTGKAWVMGTACVTGKACVSGNARVMKSSDCITIGTIGSRDDTTTFYRGAYGKIYVSCGCFNGSIDDFAAKVKAVHAGTKHEKTYLLAIELAKAQIET